MAIAFRSFTFKCKHYVVSLNIRVHTYFHWKRLKVVIKISQQFNGPTLVFTGKNKLFFYSIVRDLRGVGFDNNQRC